MASKVKAMNGKWVKARGTLSDEWNNEVKRVGKYNFHITDCEEIVPYTRRLGGGEVCRK
jgi:hypothetical protein